LNREANQRRARAEIAEASLESAQGILKRLEVYLSSLPDGPVETKVIDTICAILAGRTDVCKNDEMEKIL
jgi:hypothetical protein